MNQVFVYGTLKPGHHNWQHLEPYTNRTRTATATGTLYDTGYGWPAAQFAGTNPIPGYIVDIRYIHLNQAIAVLDHIEGVEHGLFDRVTIQVDGVKCWAYEWPSEVDRFNLISEWV